MQRALGARLGGDADDEQRASRRGAQAAAPARARGLDKLCERVRIGVAEGETDAERDAAVAQRMQADRFRRRPCGRTGRRSLDRSGDAARNARLRAENDVARARLRPARAIASSSRTTASTASAGDRPSGVALAHRRPAPTCIRRASSRSARSRMSARTASRCSAPPPSITTETLAPADRQRRRGEPWRSAAASAPASISSARIEPGERIGDDRHAVGRVDAERRHRVGESGADARRQARAPGCCRAP